MALRKMNTGRTSVRKLGPPRVSRYGVKSLKVHRLISSRLVRMWPRMVGRTTSRSCWKALAPARRAVSRCDGGTADSAAPYSSIEKAVPRQTLNTITASSGVSSSHSVLTPGSRAFRVPDWPSRNAIHRKATTEPGRIQATMTSTSTTARSGERQSRIVQARANPRQVWPTTAEPNTNSAVTSSELRNWGSVRAWV
jgi:hypothetical protein